MILVFGSINVDVIVPVPRWPVAGETVLGGDPVVQAGGKGANQALAARLAGGEVSLAGAVGSDHFAEIALAGLRAAGIDLRLVRAGARPTGCAAIMVAAGGDNLIAVGSGANREAAAAQVPDAALGPDTTLLVQLEVPVGETEALIRRARAQGGRIVLNLAPAAPIAADALAAVDLLVANEGEAASLGDAPERIAARLRIGLVVTRGAVGAVAFLADGDRLTVPALAITAVDTTGAGDAFIGALTAAFDRGLDLAAGLRRASVAGGLACLTRGAQAGMPEAATIDAALPRLQL